MRVEPLGILVLSQDEGEATSFAPLLLITALAAFIPIVSDRLKVLPVPVIVGESWPASCSGRAGLA